MGVENPVGNPDIGNKMEEFDHMIDKTVDGIDHLHEIVSNEIEERHEALHGIKDKTSNFIAIIFYAGMLAAIVGVTIFSRLLPPAVEAMRHGMNLFSQAHLCHRIDQPVLVELRELASDFNSMAENVQETQLKLEILSTRDEQATTLL